MSQTQNHESNQTVKYTADKNKKARDLDLWNDLNGIIVSSGRTVAFTHLGTWTEEAVSM